MQITPLSECQIQYRLIGLASLEPAFHHPEHWHILYCCGWFPMDFFSLFQVIASKTTLLEGRFGSVISSSDFPVRHYTGKGQHPRTPYICAEEFGLEQREMMCSSSSGDQPAEMDMDWESKQKRIAFFDTTIA